MIVWLKPPVSDRLRPLDPHRHGRPWFVVQADWLSKRPQSRNLLIAPTTSLKEGDEPENTATHVSHIVAGQESFIMCAEIQCVDLDDIETVQRCKAVPLPLAKELISSLRAVLGV